MRFIEINPRARSRAICSGGTSAPYKGRLTCSASTPSFPIARRSTRWRRGHWSSHFRCYRLAVSDRDILGKLGNWDAERRRSQLPPEVPCPLVTNLLEPNLQFVIAAG